MTIDGSSTVFPVTEAVAEEFMKRRRKVHVTVGISGTGGGFKKFCRGETDISNASRPILAEEIALAKENGIEYVELPICFDALTVVVNPQAHLGRLDHRRRIEEDLGAGGSGQDHEVESDSPGMAEREVRVVRRRFRFRNVRLLHRSGLRQSQVEPRRLHRQRRRQRARARHRRKQVRLGYLPYRLLRAEQGQAEGVGRRLGEGQGGRR